MTTILKRGLGIGPRDGWNTDASGYTPLVNTTYWETTKVPTATGDGGQRGRCHGLYAVFPEIVVGSQAVTLNDYILQSGTFAANPNSLIPGGSMTLAASTTHGPFCFPLIENQSIFAQAGSSPPNALSGSCYLTDNVEHARLMMAQQTFAYVTNGDMVADVVGPWINVGMYDEISFRESWTATGTPIGVMYFRASDAAAKPSGSSAGSDSGFSGWTNPAGTAADNIWTINLKEFRVKWLMRWYDVTSGGTGALLDTRIHGKVR